MKLTATIGGNLAAAMQQEIAAGESAVSRAMRKAAGGLKADWRRQVTAAGLGERLVRSIRSEVFPASRPSVNAAALVYSRASPVVTAFDEGALIRAQNAFWLAIPTEAAGRGIGGKRMTPEEWERRRGIKLRLVPRRGQPSLLVADSARINTRGVAVVSRSKTGRNQVTAPVFILVPQVRLSKRLDLDRDFRAWQDRVPGMIVDEWVSDRLGLPDV